MAAPRQQQQADKGQQLTKAKPVDDDHIQKISTAISTCRGSMALADTGDFMGAISVARGMRQLQELITPEVMEEILPLMNSPLGFDTDRNPNKDAQAVPYSMQTVKDCFIVATLKGARPAGNEFNIITGGAYLTKNAFRRMVTEFPGVTDLRVEYGIPKMGDGKALVPCHAKWKRDGKPDELKVDIPVKLNNRMGEDAAIGKAERKIHARVWQLLTGQRTPEADSDIDTDNPGPEGSQVVNGDATILREAVEGAAAQDAAEGSQEQQHQDEATTEQANYAASLRDDITAAENCEQLKAVGNAVKDALDRKLITTAHAEALRTHWKVQSKAMGCDAKQRQPGDE